jgi:hypothetical protein
MNRIDLGAAFSFRFRWRISGRSNSAYKHTLDISISSKGGKSPELRALCSPILKKLNSADECVWQGIENIEI